MLMVKLSTVMTFFIVISACSRDVRISMNESVPPTFSFKRNHSDVTNLDFFIVTEIAPENAGLSYSEQKDEKNKVIWQILPVSSADGALSKLPPITYGTIPVGFRQKIPAEGKPPQLQEGKLYEAGGPPVQMVRGIVRFKVVGGRVVRLPIKDIDD